MDAIGNQVFGLQPLAHPPSKESVKSAIKYLAILCLYSLGPTWPWSVHF